MEVTIAQEFVCRCVQLWKPQKIQPSIYSNASTCGGCYSSCHHNHTAWKTTLSKQCPNKRLKHSSLGLLDTHFYIFCSCVTKMIFVKRHYTSSAPSGFLPASQHLPCIHQESEGRCNIATFYCTTFRKTRGSSKLCTFPFLQVHHILHLCTTKGQMMIKMLLFHPSGIRQGGYWRDVPQRWAATEGNQDPVADEFVCTRPLRLTEGFTPYPPFCILVPILILHQGRCKWQNLGNKNTLWYAKFDSFCFSEVEDVDVEVVRATILLQLQDDVLAVDGTVACTLSWSS